MAMEAVNPTNTTGIIQLIVFRLSGQEFGVLIASVQEIIKIGQITPIPESPNFIKGLINVRGDIVPTIDLCTRFGLPECPGTAKHIILTKQDNNLFALIVDEVTEVLRVESKEIKPSPSLTNNIHKQFIHGVITYDNRLIVLIDFNKILTENELMKFYQTQAHDLLKPEKQVKREKRKKGSTNGD